VNGRSRRAFRPWRVVFPVRDVHSAHVGRLVSIAERVLTDDLRARTGRGRKQAEQDEGLQDFFFAAAFFGFSSTTSSCRIIAICATGPPHASKPNLRKRRNSRR